MCGPRCRFKDTLPRAPIEAHYPKLSPGGYCIVDDFGSHQSQAGQAIFDYHAHHGIDDEIVAIDGFGAYWRRKS